MGNAFPDPTAFSLDLATGAILSAEFGLFQENQG